MRRVSSLLALTVVACSGSTDLVGAPEGMLTFAYTGAIEGSFEATGAYPAPGQGCEQCAFATPSVQGDRLLLQASRLRGPLRDMVTMTIAYPTEPGSYGTESPSDFAYGLPSPGLPEYAFRFVSGEVVVTELGDGRVRGEFVAEGEDVALFADPQVRSIEITGGVFDVPILPR